ncbi:homing endonuclease associated repeat-containing protein [Brevibacterium aurantiacum]|uniref:Multidrug transporter n=1 Tax=Brevibacterium aurantiacum TaxID=273384 RepID=A0A556CAW8_BREAU|nr:multidrug transporter [Brevibacterium aurantiacum]TSI14540.1 multidrug transporter [Brevibacterium aurantiacum]
MRAVNDVVTDKSHTSSSALLGALLYLAAEGNEIEIDRSALPQLSLRDREILAGVEVALFHQTDDAVLVKTTLAEVAGSIAALRSSHEEVTLTGTKYDAQRSAVLAQLGVSSVKGATAWPPTSQTAVQRFGSWNHALKAAGLATNKIGRAKGQLRFDADAYDRAIAEFVADCESRELGATYKAYGEYAAEHKSDVPSAAAVRKFYGSWNKAFDFIS